MQTSAHLDPAPYLKAFAETHGESSASAANLWVTKLTRFICAEDLTADALYRWRESLVSEGYKPRSINKAIAVVRAYLRYLRIKGLHNIDSEVLGDALAPARVSTMLPTVLTREEIRKLCATAATLAKPGAVGAFLALGLLTAARPGEILRMRPEHHKPERGLMLYATKTGRERCIALSDNLELGHLLSCATASPTYCAGFSTWHFDALCRTALGRTIPRKLLRSTASSYIASSGKLSEFEYCSRLGHTLEVANAHYRSLIPNVTGSTVCEWLGAPDEIRALVKRICA